jgi:PAS domain S-box-containing protein
MRARTASAQTPPAGADAAPAAARSADEPALLEALVPAIDDEAMGASDHVVQWYEAEPHLLDALTRFVVPGLATGEAAIVIATPPHLEHLGQRLGAHGLDVATAGAQGQYVPLDAAQTLQTILVDGWPHERRFVEAIGGVVAGAGRRYPRVRIFGEMVALLWAQDKVEAALRLEELWNALAKHHAFSLLCAYAMRGFSRAVHAAMFRRVCAEHSRVIPAESYTALPRPDARLRLIAELQQKAQALEAELAERQGLEATLRRSQQELADFFENAPTGLHWLAPDGMILRANRAALDLLGYSRDEYVGRSIAEFHADPQAAADILRRLHAGEELHAYEARLVCKDGTLKHVLLDANVLWEQGRFVHTRCFMRDITAQKRAEAALQHANAELERRVEERTAALQREMAERRRLEQEAQRAQHFALLGRLAAGVSHEIRNPLGAIFLHVDLLEEELHQPSADGPTLIAQSLAEIKTQLARLDDLVQSYLSLVRVANLERQVQDLGAAVQTWAAEFAALAAPRRVAIRVRGLEALGSVAFHASTLRRALLNLVQNALDAMPQGGTITLAGARTATHAQLEVRDTGCGVPAERLSRLFEPLYTTKPGGTGLGLYIVQEIVAAHGGHIAVHSAVGRGTTFTVRLPRR